MAFFKPVDAQRHDPRLDAGGQHLRVTAHRIEAGRPHDLGPPFIEPREPNGRGVMADRDRRFDTE